MSKVEIIKRPTEKISWDVKKTAWAAIFESLVTLLLGVLLVVWPGVTVIVVSNIIGAIFIASGIYQIVNYFVVRGQKDFFNNNLLGGVIALLVGIMVIVMGEEIAGILRIVIGIWMVYEALVRMNTSIKLHAIGIRSWSYILIIGIIMLVVGLFVVFNAGAVTQLIGWMMILIGVVGIIGDTIFIQYVNRIVDVLTGKKTKDE